MGGGRVPSSSVSRLRLGPGAFWPDAHTVVDPAIAQAALPARPRQTGIITAPARVRATRMPSGGTKPDLPRRPRRLCCAASFPCQVPSSMADARMSRPTNTADFNAGMPQASTPSMISGFGAHDHWWQQLIRNILYYVTSPNMGARRRSGRRRDASAYNNRLY